MPKLLKVLIAFLIIIPGIAIHGWGLIGPLMIFAGGAISPADIIGMPLLFALFYFSCSASLLLILSIFMQSKELRKTAFNLMCLFFLICGLYMLLAAKEAIKEGKMSPTTQNLTMIYTYGSVFILIAICGFIINHRNLFRRSSSTPSLAPR